MGVGWISGAQSTFRGDPLMVDFASLIHPTIRQSSPVETLVVGSWTFVAGAPGLPEVVDALRTQTGFAIVLSCTGDLARVDAPLLRESPFDWTLEPGSIGVFSFAPAHPYLWENLDAAMSTLGGRVVAEAPYWRPNPRNHWLRRRWRELSAAQRWLLRLPKIALSRPLDRLARPSG